MENDKEEIMRDIEEAILILQDSECEDCTNCPFKGEKTCRNQCMEVIEVPNRYLKGDLR